MKQPGAIHSSPQEAQLWMRQLTALNRIARIATEDQSLRSMMQNVVDELYQQFGWEFIACVSVDHPSKRFVCEALHSELETDIRVGYSRPIGSGVVGEVALSGKTIDLPDIQNHPNFIETLTTTQSELCVPVLHRGRVLAVLNVESLRPNAFAGQRVLLETVADQIAGAVQMASVLEDSLRLNAQLREANAALRLISQVDGLTGLANRRQFDEWMQQHWPQHLAQQSAMSLILIDVDYFKNYNDHYGHLAGDDVLRRIAKVMQVQAQMRSALLARFGGEEFVVLLPNGGESVARGFAESLCDAVTHEQIPHAASPLGVVSISLGTATGVPASDSAAEQLLSRADCALYVAKHEGRNRVAIDDASQSLTPKSSIA